MYTQAQAGQGAVAHVVGRGAQAQVVGSSLAQVQGASRAQVRTWLEWAQAVACYTEAGTEARRSAIARVRRLQAGVVLATDVRGVQEWAQEYGWC
jgi:hypothetical protein